jgi:prolipoprotein diacylglyceryltransferase
VILSGFARLFFEVFRGDSLITVYNLRTAQIIAWLILVIGIWGYSQITNKRIEKK